MRRLKILKILVFKGLLTKLFGNNNICLYSSVVERCTCNAKVLGSIPSGGFK